MCTMTTECIGYVNGKWEAHKQLHNTAYQNTCNFDNSDARFFHKVTHTHTHTHTHSQQRI